MQLEDNSSCSRIMFVLFLLQTILIPFIYSQDLKGGLFPVIKDLSSFGLVKTSSTCGLHGQSMSYCLSSLSNVSITSCARRTCLISCCSTCTSTLPLYINFDIHGLVGPGVYISADRRPNSDVFSSSKDFKNGFITYSTLPTSSNFTFATWMKQDVGNIGTLIQASDSYTIVIEEYTLTFSYKAKDTPHITNVLPIQNVNFVQGVWHHITVIVCGYHFTLFVDGKVDRTASLRGILNPSLGTVRIGLTDGVINQYRGLMQDMKYFLKGITNREVIEAMSGILPDVPFSQCRCPDTHPQISPVNPYYCVTNRGVTTLIQGQVSRLSEESHPSEYLLDGSVITYWISEKVNDVSIELDLKYSRLQIYLVSITFYSPPPQGISILRSTDHGQTFQPWQYFAVDCITTYNMLNNGPLPKPTSVNCLQIPNPKPSWETITFQPAEAGPDNKPQRPFGTPGCSDYHCSPQLMEFVQATNVKISFTGHTLIKDPDHRYFGVRRIVVGGSCDCNGHGQTCVYDDKATPYPKYLCQCDPRTFTDGEQCERCMPLYRDKVFTRGTILKANPCQKCQCNDHADSCIYIASLDTDINNRNTPGGGVCIQCQHNTIGRFCESCKPLFYRKSGSLLNAIDVCQPCDCVGPGVLSGQLDCQKDDNTPGIIAGQCKCKQYASGRQCTECKPGYFDLSSTNSYGCTECTCNIPGTRNSDESCHISSGQCNCKINVIGVKCDNCKYGTYDLNVNNPEGCSKCQCNPLGSYQADTCDVVTGQCSCKERYQGRACDQCKHGFYGPQCVPCLCDSSGTEAGYTSSCNQATGQCHCKLYVIGTTCAECKKGYYGLSASNPSGCHPCNCMESGTIGNTYECDQSNGTCICKSLVSGRSCNICKPGSYGLNASNPEGCAKCSCNTQGTVGGDNTPQDQLVCNAIGQCNCLSNVIGSRCDQCSPGYYWNPLGIGCLPCNCDSVGSLTTICSVDGKCACRQNSGVGGDKCNQCILGFYGFFNGSCSPCACSSIGSDGTQCDETGKCLQCKRNVEGLKCTRCKQGTTNLQVNNPYGCSGAPSEQGPPIVTSQSASEIMLSWQPPDNPNGVLFKYELYRNTTLIYSGMNRVFNDTGLAPHTVYLYYLIVYTSGGSTRNVEDLIIRTLSDVPNGLLPPNITQIKDRSVFATWEDPKYPNGIILMFILRSVTNHTRIVEHYKGLDYFYQVVSLQPFTLYKFTITACTSVGCVTSDDITISTRSAAPDSQPSPIATPLLGGTSVFIRWDAPQKPNGEIMFYDLYSRESPFSGEGNTEASSLNPKERNYTVTNKTPFTFYEFRIVSYTAQVKGSRSSNWTRVRTLEGFPTGSTAIQPNALAINSSTVDITWQEPLQPNGLLQRYEIFRYENQTNYLTPILSGSTPGDQNYIQLSHLQPYTTYYFAIKACNRVGCTDFSNRVGIKTQPASPNLQNPPTGFSFNSSAIVLQWDLPEEPNGPIKMNYIVEKVLPVFSHPPSLVEKGVRFPGFGYYRFPSSLVPDSTKNQIEFYFKTHYDNGLLFFAASPLQEDILVIEFRDGCPWFIFDTESGAAAFTISKNTSFNDNQWHHVFVTRDSIFGRIIIDNIYEGSGSGFGLKNVIGQISDVFIGGLPNDFRILRKDGGLTTLTRMPFIGCIKDFRYKNTILDYNSALASKNVAPLSSHCISSTPGLYFKGGGYVDLKEGVFNGGKTFSINFQLKTIIPSSLILFATGKNVHFALYLLNSKLHIQLSTPTNRTTLTASPITTCDGKWHQIDVECVAQSLLFKIDNIPGIQLTLPTDMIITGHTYLGGMSQMSLYNYANMLATTQYFSGCLKDLTINSHVLYQSSVEVHYNVDFDGCPSTSLSPSLLSCTEENAVIIYDGSDRSTTSVNLFSFTEYLFRVKSYHKGVPGYGVSEWAPLHSGEGAPKQLLNPTIQRILARSALISWSQPIISGGLITHYVIHGYHYHLTNQTMSTRIADVNVMVGNITGLVPASMYRFTVEAFTAGGSVESNFTIGTTKAAAPEEFHPPNVVVYPTAFNITWDVPEKPNGDILFYQVDINGNKQFTGKQLYYFIDNLQVYDFYVIKVYVCGVEGCASNEVALYTGQLAPQGVSAPQLRVQGSREIQVKWIPPTQLNGVIVGYEIFKSLTLSFGDITSVFNSTSSTYQTVINNLVPGTKYYFRVKAFTAGGGTLGDASYATTFESAPDDIPQPTVQTLNSSTLSVQLHRPKLPNGIITKYVLFKDSVVYAESLAVPMIYTITNLSPYSKHTFQSEVCTAKGCGFSNITTAFTAHAPPIGNVILKSSALSSRSINVTWTSVDIPNGPILYALYIYGEFYRQPGDYESVNKTVMCYNGSRSNEEVLCEQLLPFTTYSIQVNASNNAGYVQSNLVILKTFGDAPEGFDQPTIIHVNSTAVGISWSVPQRTNGFIKNYTLFGYYPDINTGKYDQVLIMSGVFYQHVVPNLEPYTNYTFQVILENDFGTIASPFVNISTMEDVPEELDAPKMSFVGSRVITLDISPPGKPNGIIIYYLIYLNSTLVNRTMLKSVNVYSLSPYTSYTIHVSACTKVGCLNSSSVMFKSLQDVPEDVSAPILLSNTSRSVTITWNKPNITNGLMISYAIQRRIFNTSTVVNVVQLNASFPNTFIDRTVQPYTSYEYRIVAETIAGGTPSLYNFVVTQEGEPEWNDTLTALPLSPSDIRVTWSSPAQPNGIITHYFLIIHTTKIRINNASVFEFTFKNLEAYVGYNVSVSACTKGGCGDSPSIFVRTLPSVPKNQLPPVAEIVSNSSLRVRWMEPLKPNGPIQYYILYGRTIESLISDNITSPTDYQVLFQSVATVFDHENLGIYSLQQYKVSCVTTEGNVTSNGSSHYRTGPGYPLAGPLINLTVINHTSIQLNWSNPPIYLVKGEVTSYTVTYEIVGASGYYVFGKFFKNVTSVIVNKLRPNTLYDFQVSLFNGAGTKESETIRGKTLAGVPEGFDKPVIYSIGATYLRISWVSPRVPNGVITNYTIVANDVVMDTVGGQTLFHQQTNLKPYTDYTIKIQVCTMYACVLSDGTLQRTSPAPPTDFLPPSVVALSSSLIQVKWKAPWNENGIMIRYGVYRRDYLKCPVRVDPLRKCTYISCSIDQQLCGVKCYDPNSHECCGGVLHPINNQKTCCDENYMVKNSANDVCCGGQFYPKQTSYQCCYGYYRQVLFGHVCCRGNNGVVVGIGDQCCEDIPYMSNGTKKCLCGALYDKYPDVRQCCGGRITSIAMKCCGDEINGTSYTYNSTNACCGTSYVDRNTSLCCKNNVGQTQVYDYSDTSRKDLYKCCGTNQILKVQQCCNSIGYNNNTHTCADRSSTSDVGCGSGVTCLISQTAAAYCDRCDFDQTNQFCSYVSGYFDSNETKTEPGICVSQYNTVVVDVSPQTFIFIDKDLLPHTKYEYYVVAFNTEGNVTSTSNSTMTLMAGPENLSPPLPNVVSATQIAITWSGPATPNGQISTYLLYRVKWNTKEERLVYQGIGLTHLDDQGLEPYTGYLYILSACTNRCANISSLSIVYTEQSVPTNVKRPELDALSAYSIRVNWTVPDNPNGVIIRYNITKLDNGVHVSILPRNNLGETMTWVVTNLKPYTQYVFRVEACTVVGCAIGIEAAILTLEAAPEGVEIMSVLVVNSRTIEIGWSEPKEMNGVLLYYILRRNGSSIFQSKLFHHIDYTLQPDTIYEYTLEAYTAGGFSSSPAKSVKTPESTPEGIPTPNLKALSSSSVNVSWSTPSQPNGVIVSYAVLYQELGRFVQGQHSGLSQTSVLIDLKSFTEYHVRIQACTYVGCGTGNKASIITLESPPQGLNPPVVFRTTSSKIEFEWSPPVIPNGNITNYLLERKTATALDIPIIIYSGLRTDYIDSQLEAFTLYMYRLKVLNLAGEAVSDWITIRTLESIPEGLAAPIIQVLNSTSLNVRWEVPAKSNGIIKAYHIRSRLFSLSGNETVIKCCIPSNVFERNVSGFQPATRYEVQLGATNTAGTGYSSYTIVLMQDSLPTHVPTLYTNLHPSGDTSGTVMEIFWDDSGKSNGEITKYTLYLDGFSNYEGRERKALMRRLTPFTNYTFQLEICNSAGCIKGVEQTLTSSETSPVGQDSPTFGNVTSSSVLLYWVPPKLPNGVIILYQVLRQEVGISRRRRAETIIFSTNSTHGNFFTFEDNTVKPYTTYRYKIRVVNNQGSVDSNWMTIKTEEGVPAGLSLVIASPLTNTRIQLEWQPPKFPNGIVRYYTIFRNDTRLDSTLSTIYTDNDQKLRPNTKYKYEVAACTSADCGKTLPVYVTTLQSLPSEMLPPIVTAIGSTRIKVSWKAPLMPNGDIIEYELYLNVETIPLFKGYAFEYVVSGLQAFTLYDFVISACTNQGCTRSKSSSVRTLEDLPEGVSKPELYVISSTTIEARWVLPSSPNGIILYYLLHRNGNPVYNGTDQRFTDHTVQPGLSYQYSVTAFNSAGGTTSKIATSPFTDPSAPENMSAPSLTTTSSSTIQVTWLLPGKPNGSILRYLVLFDGKEVDVGTITRYTATGLLPYVLYEFRVKACTTAGCASSASANIRTLEAPPEMQASPSFNAGQLKHNSIAVWWQPPLKPNGNIKKYELYRKINSNLSLVYSGPDESFTDSSLEIQPLTTYQYKIIAYNSAGHTESPFSSVTTPIIVASPSGIYPISVKSENITDTAFSFKIMPPEQPFGDVLTYIIEIFQLRNITAIDTKDDIVVRDLTPRTRYLVRLFACNKVGCGYSSFVNVTTKSTVPKGFDLPPVVVEKSSTAMRLSWFEPNDPNGDILRYELIMQLVCPQATKTECVSTPIQFNAGVSQTYTVSNLTPFTHYSFKVRVYNDAGYAETKSTENERTEGADPIIRGALTVRTSSTSQNTVIVDWSLVFDLRSELRQFILYENEILAYSGKDLSVSRPQREVGSYAYRVVAETSVGGKLTTVESPTTKISIGAVTPTAGAQTSNDVWFKTVWFLALCALVCILVVFLFIACCCWKCRDNRTVYVRQREPLPIKKRYGPRITSSLDNRSEHGYSNVLLTSAKSPFTDRYNTISTLGKTNTMMSPQASRLEVSDDLRSIQETKFNENFVNEDFLWETNGNSTRELDSGLYEGSPALCDDSYDDMPIGTGFVSVNKERILFPDTHL